MNAEDFFKRLSDETGLNQSQSQGVNEILESTFLAGNKNKDTITQMISEKLGVDEAKADMIYNAAIGIITSRIIDKINPFKK
ncbi:hypothetical protein [Methanobrevibacter sp.]|uniref:hypothetical protein n=1 Tax=Methanobrevibacter sp. TaxID=66852 RepID=UPI00388E9FF0